MINSQKCRLSPKVTIWTLCGNVGFCGLEKYYGIMDYSRIRSHPYGGVVGYRDHEHCKNLLNESEVIE